MFGSYYALTHQDADFYYAPSSSRTSAIKGASAEEQTVASTLQADTPVPETQQEPSTIPATPTCTRSAVSSAPVALSISASQPGLSQLVDMPQYYQLYGYNSAEVYRQLNSCMPMQANGQRIIASTDHVINTEFTHVASGTLCVIAKVAVGVHISQLYPRWDNSAYAGRWQGFMAEVIEHENVHRDLDIRYANKILQDLQNLPPAPCDSIVQLAMNSKDANIAALNQENRAYDAATNHGMIQSMIAP